MLLLVPFILLLILFILMVLLFSGLLITFIGLLASFVGVVIFSIFNFVFINIPSILSLSVGFIILSCCCCVSLLCCCNAGFWGMSTLGLLSSRMLVNFYRYYKSRKLNNLQVLNSPLINSNTKVLTGDGVVLHREISTMREVIS